MTSKGYARGCGNGAKTGLKKGPKNEKMRFKNPVFLLAEMWQMTRKTRKKTAFFNVQGSF